MTGRGELRAERSTAVDRLVSALVTVVVFLLAVSLVVGVSWWRDREVGQAFDLLRWERETVAGRWLFLVGSPLRSDPSPDDALVRYFALRPDDPEARRLENRVEQIIEGRIDAALRELGVHVGPAWPWTVFPFVDFELASAPRVLVESPRARIVRVRTDLLRPDLSDAQGEEIERRAEQERPDRKALVVPSGGVATYPAIVTNDGRYATIVETAAHEWVHHYLAFYPLGRSYFTSRESETLNETVADLIGEEVAERVLERWGDPTRRPAATGPSARTADFNATLRALRMEVDALLADGEIEEAEARMEAVRGDLVLRGTPLRVLNQAYFAWYGTYAARPDSVDPLGKQLRDIRERTGSLPAFAREVRSVTSRAEVEALLARLESASPPGG